MYMVSALNKLQTEKHFRISVVILGDGIRTKTIFLKDRLQLFFPTMEVIAMINGLPEDESILDRADLVISLLPGVRLDKPVLEVSPFLTQNEIRVVQNRIIEFEEKSRALLMEPVRMPDLIDLLRPENIILGANASGWEDVIRLAARPLEEQKLIRPAFCDAMIQITREYGPYTTLAPGVVLLNARPKDGVNRLCMSMLLLEHPVEFDASLSISVAFVLGASDNHSHLNALFQLSKICEQKNFIAGLKKCTRSAEVLRLIWVYCGDISLTKLM
jgi:mannitol/fructose-specific phosphotransferase system IIA component (Ntr-type)